MRPGEEDSYEPDNVNSALELLRDLVEAAQHREPWTGYGEGTEVTIRWWTKPAQVVKVDLMACKADGPQGPCGERVGHTGPHRAEFEGGSWIQWSTSETGR